MKAVQFDAHIFEYWNDNCDNWLRKPCSTFL